MRSYQITEWCHELFSLQAVKGGFYIDATMGNGYDTKYLAEKVGESFRGNQKTSCKRRNGRKSQACVRQSCEYGEICTGRFCRWNLF